MTPPRSYITTTIPYVNARPHLGHALELVQADVLARHRRIRGDQVRFHTGTDDNSLKNVLAAEAAGTTVQELVDANAAVFGALAGPLSLSVDDVIRTSTDPRHRPGVEQLWRACAQSGDLYRRHYQGRRREVLAVIASGLDDFSVSRSAARARGWGIPVPGDPDQVIYVWWDALGNYVTALGYGTGGPDLRTWWTDADRRIHLVGKGVLRFHAVYWPAILVSAGLPLPTDIVVHDYLTIDGAKISKSGGPTADPAALAADFGTDALRWWLLREVPRLGDTDFTTPRLIARHNTDLANGLGNLTNRVVSLLHHYRNGNPPTSGTPAPAAQALTAAIAETPTRIDTALAEFDFRTATSAVWSIADQANHYISQIKPWNLAKAEQAGDRQAAVQLDAVLATLLTACGALGGLDETVGETQIRGMSYLAQRA
jgi:methionyl-tRNA synthetase